MADKNQEQYKRLIQMFDDKVTRLTTANVNAAKFHAAVGVFGAKWKTDPDWQTIVDFAADNLHRKVTRLERAKEESAEVREIVGKLTGLASA